MRHHALLCGFSPITVFLVYTNIRLFIADRDDLYYEIHISQQSTNALSDTVKYSHSVYSAVYVKTLHTSLIII